MPRVISNLAFLLALLLSAATGSTAAAEPGTGLFGSVEVERQGMKHFPKWAEVLARYFDESRLAEGACSDGRYNRCHYAEWRRFLAEAAALQPREQLDAVNRFMNTHAYIVDPINWGVQDYWASPGQFFTRDGDCEDYAIAKFFSLRALGFPPERLRIVVLQDTNLRTPHAVLAVQMDESELILDNQVQQVVDHRHIHHYRPLYSLNETRWWMHRPPLRE